MKYREHTFDSQPRPEIVCGVDPSDETTNIWPVGLSRVARARNLLGAGRACGEDRAVSLVEQVGTIVERDVDLDLGDDRGGGVT